jgi:hypothetical protein
MLRAMLSLLDCNPEQSDASALQANAADPCFCVLHGLTVVPAACVQVRCRTGAVENNGRPLRISDLTSYRPYKIKDNAGRDWPGGSASAAGCV